MFTFQLVFKTFIYISTLNSFKFSLSNHLHEKQLLPSQFFRLDGTLRNPSNTKVCLKNVKNKKVDAAKCNFAESDEIGNYWKWELVNLSAANDIFLNRRRGLVKSVANELCWSVKQSGKIEFLECDPYEIKQRFYFYEADNIVRHYDENGKSFCASILYDKPLKFKICRLN